MLRRCSGKAQRNSAPATVRTPGSPGAIAVAPDGKYAYVADVTTATADNVLQYRISPRTGALSSRPVAAVAGGRAAQSVTIAPDGTSAYVTDPLDGTVWQYRISPAAGRLSPLSPATVPTGGGTHDLAIAPDGTNAYVVTVLNHTVSQYRINAATGALSRRPASTAGTVAAPELIALAPTARTPTSPATSAASCRSTRSAPPPARSLPCHRPPSRPLLAARSA
jgi:6-phosphogluconolactonase (cycloisomerase 2 family)